MLYRFEYTIPANTAVASPMIETMKLSPGRVEKVDISFPAGCGGLVGIRVSRGLFQLWPLTVGEWFITDDFTINFPGTFADFERPYLLTFTGYNTDDTYDHTITVQIAVEISVDYIKQLADAVSQALPELKHLLLSVLEPVVVNSEEIKGTLTDRLAPDLSELVRLIREARARAVNDMPLSELVKL